MNATVVGYGSIGARHARLLMELGCRTSVVSGRPVDHPAPYPRLDDALSAEHPEYVVIANSTHLHYETLAALAACQYRGAVLVEKPVFDHTKTPPRHQFRQVFVGYNLRFHPVIRRLRELLEHEQIISVQAYAGQYLPAWRPAGDYRASYSASTARGGGVLRDLSHELDYLSWILGAWQRVGAVGGHLSALEIDSEDMFALLYTSRRCPAIGLQLNYLDRMGRRFVVVNTMQHTIEADLNRGKITIDRNAETFVVERDDSYLAMHRAVLSGENDALCTIEEGMETLRLIEAAERAAATNVWIGR